MADGINWGGIDTQYGEKLGNIFNPNLIAERNNKLAELAQGQQLRNMQVMQAQNEMARLPIKQGREDTDYAQKVAEHQLTLDDARKKREALAEANDPKTTPERRNQLLAFAFPEEAAKQAFKPSADVALSGLGKAMQERAAIAKSNPNDPRLLAYDNLIRKESETAKQITPQINVGGDNQRGQIIFDSKGNAFNVNPYTNEVKPVAMGGNQIQGAQWTPGLAGQISESKAMGAESGKATGEAQSSLKEAQSQLPNLETLVGNLSALGKKATYTKAGQGYDFVRKETGFDPSEGAVARTEYISKVDNEVLPLLRQTFGAAFTVKEGETLRATLGDPNKAPLEKDAVLRSFIAAKKAQIQTLNRRVGQPAHPQDNAAMQWARSNPNDPRSAAILKANGG